MKFEDTGVICYGEDAEDVKARLEKAIKEMDKIILQDYIKQSTLAIEQQIKEAEAEKITWDEAIKELRAEEREMDERYAEIEELLGQSYEQKKEIESRLKYLKEQRR